LYRDREKFEAAGVRLAVIGQGEPAQAAEFRRSQSVDLPLLVDRERISYEAAGAKLATVGELVGPRIVGRMLKRTIASRLPSGGIAVNQGRIVNHPAQLGGVLIIAPDGSVRYAHMSEDSSDIPPNEEVLAAARAIRPHVDAGRVEELGLGPERPAAPFEAEGGA